MNDSSVIRDGIEELEILCYKVLALIVKQYIVICKWTWSSHKCILQTLVQPLKKI